MKDNLIRKQSKNPDLDDCPEEYKKLEKAYDEQRDFDEIDEISYNDEISLAEIAWEDYLAEVEYAEYLKGINSSYSNVFDEKIASIENIMTLRIVDEKIYKDLLIMLYGHTIAAIEGYIYATFFNTVIQSEEFLKKLVETDPGLQKQTIKVTAFL